MSIPKHGPIPRTVRRLQEFSVPLIAGVVMALLVANVDERLYHTLVQAPIPQALAALFSSEDSGTAIAMVGPGHQVAALAGAAASHHAHGDVPDGTADEQAAGEQTGHSLTSLGFLINDIFMVFFFGIAAKEITESCLPGGALNPPAKAINPLLGTAGGVLGPIGVYFVLNAIMGQDAWARGWGIPTATDIALAWLGARLIFGAGHPAISFLLLLAIADDAIGLGIIAFAYPDPHHPVQWFHTAWILPGIALAFGLRKKNVQAWWPYVLFGGGLAWWGLYSAHLHPALALVFIVPFIPGPKRDLGLYLDDADPSHAPSPLEKFEHDIKLAVDGGLFFFAFANAGVPFSGISNLTWIVLAALVIGKTGGITLFAYVGSLLGFPLPQGMTMRHLVVTAMIAGLGLTVALFVSNQAFSDAQMQGAAKMGALLSASAGLLAFVLAQALGVGALAESGRCPSGWPGRRFGKSPTPST